MVAEFFFKKIFVISLQQLYFVILHAFLPPEENTSSKKNFDSTKSNYLFDQVNKWFVLQDLG